MNGIKGVSTTFFAVAILLFLPSLVLGDSLVIDQNGNVGIGTSSPSEKLEVDGSLKISGGIEMPSNISIGSGVMVTGENNIAIGTGVEASGGSICPTIAIGYGAYVYGEDSIAIGRGASVDWNRAIALGGTATAGGRGIAIGKDSSAPVGAAIAIGSDATAPYSRSVAIGRHATATADRQLVIGCSTDNLDTYIYGDLDVYGQVFVDKGTGNLGIGTTAFGSSGTRVFGIANGTEPTSSPIDMIQLYAKDYTDGDGTSTSELFVRDEDGNAVDLSPHIFALFQPDPTEPLPWAYYAENKYTGKRINVDMAGAIRALEQLAGKQFIYYEDIPKIDPVKGKFEVWKQQWIQDNTREIMILKAEAFETVESQVEDKNTILGEKVRYQLRGEDVIEIREPKYAKITIKRKQLKKNVRFCTKTGNFFERIAPTEQEAEAAVSQEFELTLKRWVRDRM